MIVIYQFGCALWSLGNAAMFGRMDFVVAAMCRQFRFQAIWTTDAEKIFYCQL